MTTKYRYFLAAMILTASFLMFLAIHKPSGALAVSFSQNDNSKDSPIVDYDTEVIKEKSKARKEKDSHFKGVGNPNKRRPIAELPEGVEPLLTVGAWWVGLSPLPIDQSDIIVLGDVVAREAHLSDDKTGIYSEFTVQVDQVFKDTTGTVLVGGSLSATRLGGSVRFASGKIQKYGLARHGMPRNGSQYVLFLRKTTDGDLLILTGYELSGGHVTPLDGEDTGDPRTDLPFAKYRGAYQTAFLAELSKATASSTGGAK
jgi:hypothetical protein